jgi:hypothetical protein
VNGPSTPYWLWSNLWRKAGCEAKDVEQSERLLGQNVPEKFDLEGAGPYEQPICPKCGSMDGSFEGLMNRVAGAGLFLWFANNWQNERLEKAFAVLFLTLRTTRVAAPPLSEMQFCQAGA